MTFMRPHRGNVRAHGGIYCSSGHLCGRTKFLCARRGSLLDFSGLCGRIENLCGRTKFLDRFFRKPHKPFFMERAAAQSVRAVAQNLFSNRFPNFATRFSLKFVVALDFGTGFACKQQFLSINHARVRFLQKIWWTKTHFNPFSHFCIFLPISTRISPFCV